MPALTFSDSFGLVLESPLTWRVTTGQVLVDVVRTAPPSRPLADTDTPSPALPQAASWAESPGLRLAGVRLRALSAPATSLLHDQATGLVQLADTQFASALATPAGVAA